MANSQVADHTIRPGPRFAHLEATDAARLHELKSQLGQCEFALVSLFVSPAADFATVVEQAQRVFVDTLVIACTTAGEIGVRGYTDDSIAAVAYPAADFTVAPLLIDDLTTFDPQDVASRLIQTRHRLAHSTSDKPHEFAFLVIDGMSLREDSVMAALEPGLGSTPLFGGSAGDGRAFQTTQVALDGQVIGNAAVLAVIRSRGPIKVFSHDHLRPSDVKMVVTGADPDMRRVRRINAAPAGSEYARILGLDPAQLDTFTFAAHPVVVQIGGRHHVRSIQRVTPEGDLLFFSAIDEGAVLTVATSENMVAKLDAELAALRTVQTPTLVLACDCLLRRMEAEQKQIARDVSSVMSAHEVVGFSTYGEQLGGMHVNQTMTGVAFYPPIDEASECP